MEHPGVAGEGDLATKKKDLEAGGTFSIRDILGSGNSGRKKKPDQPPIMPPFLPPPLPPTHLPLFHPIPPIFPFLPFNYNSQTYQSSPPVQKKVGTPLGNTSQEKICFLSGIAQIAPPLHSGKLYHFFGRQKRRFSAYTLQNQVTMITTM